MICESCGKQKDKLHVVDSQVVPSLKVKLCASCKHDRLEPRPIIILAAHAGRIEQVKQVVVERRYIGAEIKLKEILA